MTLELVEEAERAVARGDLAAGLARLLEAWRARPIAPVGDAIDALGKAAAAAIPVPAGVTLAARRAAWEALAARVAREPAVLGPLLATVTDTRGFAQTWERLARLERETQGDPRVAQRICDLIEALAYNPAGSMRMAELWLAMFDALAASRDPRLAARVRGFEAAWLANRGVMPWRLAILRDLRDACVRRLGELRAATPARAEVEACARVIAAVVEPAPVEGAAALLDAIREAPDDDAPRAVYADWLLQQGDPRGELIGLQLARARGERGDERREQRLLAEHGRAWLGALADAVVPGSVRFERGFLAACELREPRRVIDDDPAWATVVTLGGGVPGSDACRVPALRALGNVDGAGIEQLARLTVPLAVEALAWAGPRSWMPAPDWPERDEDGLVQLAAFERIRVLPRLRRLALQGHAWLESSGEAVEGPALAELRRVLAAPCAAGLEELALPAPFGVLDPLLAELELGGLRVVELRAEAGEGWERCWRARFTRDVDGALSRVVFAADEAHYRSALQHYAYGYEVLLALEWLEPARLTDVRVEVSRVAHATAVEQLEVPLRAMLARHTRIAQPQAEAAAIHAVD